MPADVRATVRGPICTLSSSVYRGDQVFKQYFEASHAGASLDVFGEG
jgi:hypothetical protein